MITLALVWCLLLNETQCRVIEIVRPLAPDGMVYTCLYGGTFLTIDGQEYTFKGVRCDGFDGEYAFGLIGR